MAEQQERPRLGDVLIRCGLVTPEQITEALGIQEREAAARRLGEILLDKEVLTEDQLQWALGTQLDIPYVHVRLDLVDRELVRTIPRRILERYEVLPLMRLEDTLTLVMADPLDEEVIADVAAITGCEVRPVFGLRRNILGVLEEVLGAEAARAEDRPPEVELGPPAAEGEPESVVAPARPEPVLPGPPPPAYLPEVVEWEVPRPRPVPQPALRPEPPRPEPVPPREKVRDSAVVKQHLLQAVQQGASEIHFEPLHGGGLRVRYRIDGLLHDQEVWEGAGEWLDRVINRLKIMAGLDLQERKRLQQGGFRSQIGAEVYNFALSIFPTIAGESAVVHIIPRTQPPGLPTLGFNASAQAELQTWMDQPEGVILISGPEHSGKTTTAYALLQSLEARTRKVVTVEDRIRYAEERYTQIELEPGVLELETGLTIALRQSADVLLVNPLNSEEALRRAFEAALHGMLVLGTVFYQRVEEVLAFLAQSRLDRVALRSALLGVVQQRLVALPCPHCVRPGVDGGISRAKGCEMCHFTGVVGRELRAEIVSFVQGQNQDRLAAALAAAER